MMKGLTYLGCLVLVFGCGHKNEAFKSGTFQIIENDSIVGELYRFGNYQIEKYPGRELIARIEYKTDSSCLMHGIEKDPMGIDTIVWLNKFKETSKGNFLINATPYNVNVDYMYEGMLLKIDEGIDERNLNRLDSLNESLKFK